MALIVGLTGGIGSGKSTVANLFAERGAGLVDADLLAHELTEPHGAAIAEILAAFGEGYVDTSGALNRSAMRQRVFTDAMAKRRLEGILHPRIRALADERLELSSAPYCLLVVPLLIESGAYRRRVDRVLVVDCDEQAQVRRTVARSGLSEEAVLAIMAQQASRTARLAAADDVIDNSGDAAALVPQVESLHRRYLASARA